MKRILALLLVLCMALSLAACGSKEAAPEEIAPENAEEQASGTVTRGEWLVMLAESFGLDTYESDSPYYSDISQGNNLFPAVQSAAEWGILSSFTGESFEPDKPVTREEVADSAARASGFRDGGEMATEYAVRNGIISDGTPLTDGVDRVECENAVEAAVFTYLNAPREEEISVEWDTEHTFYDLTSETFAEAQVNESSIVFPADCFVSADDSGFLTLHLNGEDINIGVNDVFFSAPSATHPFGVARKVSGLMFDSHTVTFELSTPELDDLYDELVIHTTLPADLNRIVWADGITAVPASSNGVSTASGANRRLNLLASYSYKPPEINTLENGASLRSGSYTITFEKGDYSKTRTGNNSKMLGSGKEANMFNQSNFVYDKTPSTEDFKGGTSPWTEKLHTENKYSTGYAVTGNLTINEITVMADVEYHKGSLLGMEFTTPIPEAASMQIKTNITSSLKLEGNLSERLKIATIPVPIGATGLTVSVDLYLYADASGSLQVEAAFTSVAKAEWESLAKLKHTADSGTAIKTEAAIAIDFGADLAASLDAFAVKIMDVGVKCGGELDADAYVSGKCETSETTETTTLTYTESMNLETKLYAPVLSIYIGGEDSLIEKAGIEGTWDIKTKDHGAKVYDLLDKKWEFWREVVTLDKNGNIINSETTTAGPMEQEYDHDRVFAEMQRGDFSYFAGTYRAVDCTGPDGIPYTMGGETVKSQEFPDIVLGKDGRVTGGGSDIFFAAPFSGLPPASVTIGPYDKQSFYCLIQETVMNPTVAGEEGEGYYIYPVGSGQWWGDWGNSDIIAYEKDGNTVYYARLD